MILAIINAIAAFLKVATSFIDYMERQRLIDSGAAQAQLDMMRKNLDATRIAIAAREVIRADIAANPGKLPEHDPFRRD